MPFVNGLLIREVCLYASQAIIDELMPGLRVDSQSLASCSRIADFVSPGVDFNG